MYGIPFRPGKLSARGLFWCLLGWGCLVSPSLGADTKTAGENPEASWAEKTGFSWDLLSTGSLEDGKTLTGRGDLRLHLDRPGLTLRTQLVDKRTLDDTWKTGNTAFSGGLYHEPTGSRILYGIQDEWGLPARIRNPWARAVPFAENHKTSINDLKTEPSTTKEEEFYLLLKSPRLGPFSGFASVLMDQDLNLALGSGAGVQINKQLSFAAEGFYTRRKLSPRNSSAWFDLSPPLPARDFQIYALGLVFSAPFIDLASDWAYSETFAYGRDLYGSLGLRLRKPPWTLSLGFDGAGNRYVGRDGSAPGAGFRAAGRIERRGKRSGLFRLGVTLRSPGLGSSFERGSYLVSYRFPRLSRNFPVNPSRVSLSLNRNASNREKIEDRLEGTMGFTLGPVRPALSVSVTGFTTAERAPAAFPAPKSFGDPHSAAFSGELSYPVRIFLIKTKLGYTARKEKDGVWETSLSLTARQKPGRFSLKIASPELPEKWTWEISWRLEL
jgi:hypothetical protein